MIELAVILLILVIVPLALWKAVDSKTDNGRIMDRRTAERAVRADLSEHEGRERRIEREQNDP